MTSRMLFLVSTSQQKLTDSRTGGLRCHVEPVEMEVEPSYPVVASKSTEKQEL